MTLTSNQTSWAVMIVTIIISCSFGALTTWLTIKAQYAKNINEIQDAIKSILLRFVFWACNIYIFITLILEVSSSAPMTRKDVFVIGACFFNITLSVIYKLLETMLKMSSLTKKQVKLAELQSNDIERIIKTLEQLPSEKE